MMKKAIFAMALLGAMLIGVAWMGTNSAAASAPGDPDCVGLGTGNYDVPLSNPFVDGAGGDCDEIWAVGMRNPWRFSFDRATGDMWIGDVGQVSFEEVNFQPASSTGGENYGWRCYEANSSFELSGCNAPASYTFPALEIPRGPWWDPNCSVIGGFVYRGSTHSDLVGHYFASDYCTGKIWDLYPNGSGGFTSVESTIASVDDAGTVAFAEDNSGELYLVKNGTVYAIADSNPGNGNVDLQFTSFASVSGSVVGLVSTGATDDSMFAVAQEGRIYIVESNGSVLGTPFLDIRTRVDDSSNEEGLLGIAFDPNYNTNGYFYVNYIHTSNADGRHTRISRFSVNPTNPNLADDTSEEILLTVAQHSGNHNAGDLKFGPDGYLYIPMGDGGGAGDTGNYAQNMSDPLGKILRIDVGTGTPTAVALDSAETTQQAAPLIAILLVSMALFAATTVAKRRS